MSLSAVSLEDTIYQHVKQSENAYEPDVRARRPRRRVWEKFGTYNLLAFVISTLAAVVAVGFLAFTWSGASRAIRGAEPPALWLMILEKQWMARVVTVSTVLVRFAISTQMAILAAILAAIALERCGVFAEQLALLSIVRTANNGPQSHLYNAFRTFRSRSHFGYPIVVLVAFLVSVALQFTSTLLLSDFRTVNIVLKTQQEVVAFGNTGLPRGAADVNADISYALASTGADPWRNAPATYSRFAELAQLPSTAANYIDTGSTLRAFVPFNTSSQRSALQNYSGPGSVVDTRVICIPPPSITLFRVEMNNYQVETNSQTASLYFNISLDGSYPGLNLRDPRQHNTENMTDMPPDTFVCGAHTIGNNSAAWGLSVCDLSMGFWSVDMDISTQPEETADDPWSYLLLNMTGGDQWFQAFLRSNLTASFIVDNDTGVDPNVGVQWQQSTSGPWQNIFAAANGYEVGLNATVCFTNPASVDDHVDISGKDQSSEPVITWTGKTRDYNTESARHLLGAVANQFTIAERGIFDLQPPSKQAKYGFHTNSTTSLQSRRTVSPRSNESSGPGTLSFVSTTISSALYWWFTMDSVFFGFNYTNPEVVARLMPTLIFDDTTILNSPHAAHSAIFSHTLKETGNPALALQALITVLIQVTYYDALPRFEISDTAQYRMVSSVNIPAQWTGFIVVMALLTAHLVLVFTAIGVFVFTTQHSLLGSAWQAVAQITSPDTFGILHHAANSSDKEVKRYLEMSGRDKAELVLQTSMETGRDELTRRHGS